MEEKTKKKRHNRKFLAFGVIALFAFAVISAALVTNFFSHSADFEVTNPISVDGATTFSQSVMGGEVITGETFTISNDGSVEIDVEVANDAVEGIDVSYFGELELTQKTVNFDADVWEIPEGANKVNLKYTAIGDSFDAEILVPLDGYSLIYYKDNSDRFNNPAEVILVGDVSGNLPYEMDGNADEYDYCETGEYLTCHGAKIWYVPTTAINLDGSLDWSRASEFYFESKLIQYNSEGDLTMYSGDSLTLTPEYSFSVFLESGTYTVVTEVNPTA